ncbi:hypothetical protein [Paraburkholderia nemoris]|uniref:hypothetical protein n=1 Tax=Paraburkholderia nemoris TaxID=2793076 RepID=UPI001B08DEFA|nr:hypothetical protein [Paraburkholderia nemoris]CAE6732404.1 hypothetical protein R75777_02129 [Paraburkholderia nemoris]
MNLVDVTQDGAGIVGRDDSAVDGLITGLVETCCVYVFYGKDRYAIVHDTAQLAVQAICEIAKRCGSIESAFYAVNPTLLSKELSITHRERRERLKNLLRVKRGIQRLDIPDGNIVCLKDGTVLTQDEQMLALNAEMLRIPKRDIRKSINLLNNLFSSKNSQSLAVDLQFDIDYYTPLPPLLKTEAEMLAIANAKLQQGDPDYLTNLEVASEGGVFNSEHVVSTTSPSV